MATLSDKITGMPFAHVNDISMVNFMQKHGTNVPNKIMSSNNDFLFDIDPDTQLSHTSAKDQCMYYSNQFKSRFVSTTETISMVHVNIRSARKNLTDFLCSLKCLDWKFNFIIFSEIWGNPDTAKLNIVEGYSHVYDARQRRIGGGVSIYIDLRIPYRIRSDLKLDNTIFESIFIEVDNILYDKQFGFRKGHSTSHAIITLVNKVSKSLDEGKIVGGVYLDIRKAFDSISHQILLDKLHKIGIRGNIHCLLKSYLMSRSQYVICNGAKSEVKFVETGVPQGSILGPLLFILFMNHFSRSSTLLFSILFADDTSVFLEGTEYSKLIKTLNNELENVTKWLNANRLTVNMKKTHYMIFHRAKFKTTGQDVVMQNSALTCVTTTKFLGVIIDHKFKWNDHITYVKRKISKSIGILYKIRRFLDMNTLIQMYHSFVFPYLIYCVEIWGNASAIHLDPLKKIQKKSIRAITFSEFSAPSEPLFQRSNILNFDKLVFQRICLMMFKHHIGVVPKPISDLFQTNDNFHSYSTRNSQALRTPIGKSEAIYQTFTYIGSLAWNYISSKIPTDVSYICFKNYAKLHIQANSLPQIRLNV